MPIYTMSDRKGNNKDFFFEVAAAPSIGTEIKIKNKYWTRIPSNVQVAADIRLDPFDKKKFLEKTNKPGTMGGIFDLAQELGKKREEKIGEPDAAKKAFIEKSKKRRRGKFIDRKD